MIDSVCWLVYLRLFSILHTVQSTHIAYMPILLTKLIDGDDDDGDDAISPMTFTFLTEYV